MMKPTVARGVLCLLAPVYLVIYLFVLFVATVTSGDGLVRQPGAWYAALAPLIYVVVAGLYGFGWMRWRMPRGAAIALHVAVIPALAFSFLGLGLLLPVFAALWWFMAREPRAAVA